MPLDGSAQRQQSVLDVLRAVREQIAKPGGWCQQRGRVGSAKCLAAALWDQIPPRHVDMACLAALYRELPAGWRSWRGLVRWNDAPDRTQAEVVALVDRAIARLGGAA